MSALRFTTARPIDLRAEHPQGNGGRLDTMRKGNHLLRKRNPMREPALFLRERRNLCYNAADSYGDRAEEKTCAADFEHRSVVLYVTFFR